MCSSNICNVCKKISFVGCGQHLDKIFAGKKATDLCHCNPKVKEYIKKKGLN